ncbi:DinB family protein [Trebonia kvetii]|uniref:DinB family protein n=1 Tax=Trebonia kvetii TaxID=2480626 RepID=A0A6P2C1V8_9ACTN|nr:maleylpyruvate isomerase N-terminal domain-containing protein [Trebonia kvetii]TVZ04947.1 DinB family protein [Trebonia kvetii]
MTAIATPANRAALRDLLRAENEQLTQLLGGLTAAQWQTESLCAGWTVREVAAHLTAVLARGYPLPFLRIKARTALLETVVHQQDIRRPLGAAREIPASVLCTVLATAARTYPARTGGLCLQAFDLPWIRYDDGPPVTGPGEALLMAMCGRPAALAELTGAGVAILASRIGGKRPR